MWSLPHYISILKSSRQVSNIKELCFIDLENKTIVTDSEMYYHHGPQLKG